MAGNRSIEVFSAGCPICEEFVARLHEAACTSCVVTVLDMKDPAVAERAWGLGIRSVPAVVIDGALADCGAGSGPDLDLLRAAGLGRPIV